MKKIAKKRIAILLSCSLLIPASGCFHTSSPEEKAYQTLEGVVKAEKDFKNQQKPLKKLEQQDNELYAKIVSLGMKEFDQIQSLSEEAIKGIEARRDLMDKEKKSMEKAKDEFNDFDKIISDLEGSDLQKQAKELQKTMTTRYDEYDKLYSTYNDSLNEEENLYKLFQKKDLTMDELTKQIESMNKTYNELVKVNENFNKLTDEYNEQKITFYKEAGLKIKSS